MRKGRLKAELSGRGSSQELQLGIVHRVEPLGYGALIIYHEDRQGTKLETVIPLANLSLLQITRDGDLLE